MMERNYKLMVSVLDCFSTDYKEFDKVVFNAADGYTIHNAIEVGKYYLSVNDVGDVIIYSLGCKKPIIESVIWLHIESDQKKIMQITRTLAKLNII